MHMKVPGTYFLVKPTVKMLGQIVNKILLNWMPLNIKVSLPDLISYPEKSHFHGPRSLLFTVSFAMPTAVRLSQCIGIGGCACPNSSRMPSFVLRNKAPSSASAAEETRNLRIPPWTQIYPLSGIGSYLLGTDPRKTFPAVRLLVYTSDRYDASE